MDPSAPTAAEPSVPPLALSIALALTQALPGLLNPSPLPSSGPEVDGNEREFTFQSLSCTDGSLLYVLEELVFGGPGCTLQVTPQGRLFWPKSCSFDYLYSYGETLLQNFPVQATINLYEDSDSEEEEEEEEDEEEEDEEQ